jgi:hypothetical protein
MVEAWLLAAAYACTVSGMASCALAMDVHWRQVSGQSRLTAAAVRRLRVRGALALAGSLMFCLAADHLSIAALVWVMMLSSSAVLLAFTLAYRPRALRLFLVRTA